MLDIFLQVVNKILFTDSARRINKFGQSPNYSHNFNLTLVDRPGTQKTIGSHSDSNYKKPFSSVVNSDYIPLSQQKHYEQPPSVRSYG